MIGRVTALAVLLLFLIAAATTPDADGASPSTGQRAQYPSVCWTQMPDPQGATASTCREQGWTITRMMVVNPDGRAITEFPKCRQEDSRRCYWNARLRGNHHGHSFIDHGHLGVFYSLRQINGKQS